MARKRIPTRFQLGRGNMFPDGGQSYTMWSVPDSEVVPRWERDENGDNVLVGGVYNGHPVDYVASERGGTATASNMMTDNLMSHWLGDDEDTRYNPKAVAEWYRNPTDGEGNYVPFEMPLKRVHPEFDIMMAARGLGDLASKVALPRTFRNPNRYYREVARVDKGIEDAIESGVIRVKPSSKFLAEQEGFGAASANGVHKISLRKKSFTNPMFKKGNRWYKDPNMDVIVGKEGNDLVWENASKSSYPGSGAGGRHIVSYNGNYNGAPSRFFQFYRRYRPGLYLNVTEGFPQAPKTGLGFVYDSFFGDQYAYGGKLRRRLSI